MTETSETPSTKDQAQQAAGTAAQEGKHVAGVAADEARSVADEAKTHAKGLLDEAMTQADEQTRTQRDRIAGTLQTFGDDLEQMASGGTGGLAAELAQQAADRARTLGQHLDGREPSDLLDDVRRFARQRPGTFLIGALAAGVVVGRLARGAKDAGSTSTPSAAPATTPVAPPMTPATPAVPSATSYDDPTVAAPVLDPTLDPSADPDLDPTLTGGEIRTTPSGYGS